MTFSATGLPAGVKLDAATGRPIPSFGTHGRVDLRAGLGRPIDEVSITATTPGIVYRDLLIMGSLVPESLPSAPGDIRAYDVRTGKLRWSFHTIPHPGEPGYDTASGLISLLGDESRRKRLGAAALKTIVEHFDLRAGACQMADLFAQIGMV